VLALATSPTFVTPALGTPASGDFSTGTFTWPTFNQNTSGTAAGLSATLAVASGGTGQTSYTDGQLLIGNSTGNTLTKATLTAGANITITNGNGSITIAATGGGGSGTVTSVSGTGTVSGITLTGTVTTSGSLTLGGTLDLSSPPAIGGTTPAAITGTTITATTLIVNDNSTFGSSNTDTATFTGRIASEFTPATNNTYDLGRTSHEWRNLYLAGSVTLSGGTANGVTYLNGSKVLTSGSALQFDGTSLFVGATSAAAGKLVVKDTASSNTLWLVGRTSDGASSVSFRNAADSAYNARLEAFSGQLVFEANGSEQMRLTSTGLGIGTSSPTGYLANKLVIATGTDSNNGITIASASNRNGSIWFADGTTGNQSYRGGVDYQHTTDTLYLYSGAQGNFQLDASGNLGLGVTPSAWASGTYAFQTGSRASLRGAGGLTTLANNYYDNGTNAIYIATAAASDYYQSAGSHVWRTAPSGTAGNAITLNQVMTLTGTGLGLGTTTHTSQLGVNGVIQVTNAGNPSSGAGLEIGYGTTTASRTSLISYNRTGSAFLGADYNALDHYFYTSGTERARIDSSGNLLVGTTSAIPGSPTRGNFYNASSASAVVGVQNARNVSGDVVNAWVIGSNANNTSSYFLQCGVSGVANVFYIYGNGNVQNTNNSYGGISDVKLKENIVDATPKLADLMQVKVRSYNMIGSTTKQLGVVAQELETVFPSMVDETPDRDEENNVLETTTKSVKYSVFVPMLIKAIQEQQAIIESLKARLDAANL
jgi:hypothetical protein